MWFAMDIRWFSTSSIHCQWSKENTVRLLCSWHFTGQVVTNDVHMHKLNVQVFWKVVFGKVMLPSLLNRSYKCNNNEIILGRDGKKNLKSAPKSTTDAAYFSAMFSQQDHKLSNLKLFKLNNLNVRTLDFGCLWLKNTFIIINLQDLIIRLIVFDKTSGNAFSLNSLVCPSSV